MASGLAEAIRIYEEEKGISHELALKTIEDTMLAAYKKKFGTVDGVEVKFSDDENEVYLQVKKRIVDDVIDDAVEIDIDEAKEKFGMVDCEIGDELLIDIDPQTFRRMDVQSAHQRINQRSKAIKDDKIYSEFIDKVGEMIVGYCQREHNGNIFVDLGKTEGILPKRYQSPREVYHANDRIKAYVYEVKKDENGLSIVLSRTHTEFVKKLFELEVPEIADKTFKIVREPGYRVKMSVYTHRDDIDPVGACVGLRGARIQAVVREMEGEKIDVLKYDTDPTVYIKNALSPAEVQQVYILDEAKRQALAVVSDSQLSLAIGKQGLNVRLANRLVDWNIDVKTESQFQEMDIFETKKAVSDLFGESGEQTEEITKLSELPDIPERIVNLLAEHNIVEIETFISMSESKLLEIPGFTKADFELVKSIIEENVEIMDDDIEPIEEEADAAEELDEEKEYYECPECGKPITEDMDHCPNCGVELSFEEEEDEEEAGEESDDSEDK